MADGPFGARVIVIDLTIAGARVLRDVAAEGRAVIISTIRINGIAGAGSGDIVLRSDSASGNVVFKELAPAGISFDGTAQLDNAGIRCQGLYMDALGTAWTAGSHMEIYTS